MIWDVGVPSRGLAGCSTMPVPNPSCFVMTAQKDRYKAPKTDYSFFPWDLLICLKGRVIERWTEREREIYSLANSSTWLQWPGLAKQDMRQGLDLGLPHGWQ